MKKLNYLLLSLLMLFSFSCSKEEKDSKANYQALGITSVTINGIQIPVNNGTLLDLNNISTITVDRMENNVTKKQIQMSYIVVADPGSSLSVQVESSFSNTSVNVNKEHKTNLTEYNVVVTREGYNEQVTYIFRLLTLGSSGNLL